MPSLTIEHFDLPSSGPGAARMLGAARARAGDGLAGRTVWCATALPGGRATAQALHDDVDDAVGGVVAGALDVRADDPLRTVAERLDGMLDGRPLGEQPLGAAERELIRDAFDDGDVLIGAAVGPDDVVVVHDALTALLMMAVRERGAHAVWQIRVTAPTRDAAVAQAREFLGDFTTAIDAYIMSWSQTPRAGRAVDRFAALMPSAGVVAAKEIPVQRTDDGSREVAVRSLLADLVRGDRAEAVGGTRHPRPAVAAR
jgi:hypothetical protein